MIHEKSPLIAANDQEAPHIQQAAGQVRTSNTTQGVGSCTADQPLNWDGSWKQIPLLPPKGTKSRQPKIARPENLVNASAAKIAQSEKYWNEIVAAEWSQLTRAVNAGYHIGLIPQLSGLVILDCDVKKYNPRGEAYDYDPYVYGDDGVMSFAEPVFKHGIDDLKREVEKLGHSLSELKTYCVQTKSGGYHLYFKQNPRHPIEGTLHHRSNWRIDVIASGNNWVAAPPTPHYHVVEDVSVAELPDWLATFLLELNDHTLPLGGTARKRAENARKRAIGSLNIQERISGAPVVNPNDLWALLEDSVIYEIVLANRYGGWNNAIYTGAKIFTEFGYSEDEIYTMVLGAAEPTNALEKKKAEDTIASAIRRYRRNHGGR